MRISSYSKIIRNQNPATLFNALTRYEVAVEKELLEALKNRDFNKFDDELVDDLSELGILVHDDCDEFQQLKNLIQEEIHYSEELDITFSLTSKCNMACSYCVQDGWRSAESSIDDIFIRWVKRLLAERGTMKLKLSFFGGEPLIRKESITTIARELKTYCDMAYVNFAFDITTNGTLINPDDIIIWKHFGLKNINVTIDGIKDSHDSRRKYKSGNGTFEDILDNLNCIKDLIAINLISNISEKEESLSEFLRYLKYDCDVDFAEIRIKPFFKNKGRSACFYDSAHIDILNRIWREAESLSLPVDRSVILGPCGFFKENSLVVSPDGKIYPCTPFLGIQEFQLGSIESDFIVEKNKDLLNNLPHKCNSCSFSPICCGGCRFVSFQRKGDIAEPTCEKALFKSVFSTI